MAEAHDIRPVPRWRQQLAAFWRWWTGELALLLPDRFATATAERGESASSVLRARRAACRDVEVRGGRGKD